ncbi:MAG: carboxypeptidase M32, partial [Roseibacillus sp.]|nr:carboxypeptidase M32 [Roseibacillus sp.]
MSVSAYQSLCELARERALISTTASVLGWDQETGLPPAAVSYRASQLAWLSGKAHELTTSDRWRATLEAAEAEGSDDPVVAANLREFRHHFDRSAKLPRELVERDTESSSHGKAAWVEARKESDFSRFAPSLNNLLDIAREKAELWGYDGEPYDAL